MKCPICLKEFENAKSLSNHKRWHDLPQFKEFQKSYKEKASQFNLENKNGMWKGGNVGYDALHDYIKRRKPKPQNCQNCGKEGFLDLTNISQNYKRDLNDWRWLCRSCHMKKDGRMNNLKQYLVINH